MFLSERGFVRTIKQRYLHTARYTLHVHIVCYTLHTAHCTMQYAHRKIITAHITLHTEHCALRIAYCLLHIARGSKKMPSRCHKEVSIWCLELIPVISLRQLTNYASQSVISSWLIYHKNMSRNVQTVQQLSWRITINNALFFTKTWH